MAADRASDRAGILQGTLDMLILRTLLFGPAHGHQIAKHIQQTTEDLLRLEHGSLYPALHRLERKGLVAAKWETLAGQRRECKYYRLTSAGRHALDDAASRWDRMARAIASVMTTPRDAREGST
jgi:PadR family transcriptional regulator, regulatory protein PadR